MNRKYLHLLFLLCLICLSCNDNDDYKNALNWVSSIKPGTSMTDVRKSRPNYVVINWDHPLDKIDTINKYDTYIIEIKNYSDVLKSTYGLMFSKEKYVGRYEYRQ